MSEQQHLRPIMMMMGHLHGVSSKDARSYVEGLTRRHFDSLENIRFALRPWRDGIAYEIQAGGNGKGYLSVVLKRLEHDPSAKIMLPLAERMMEVFLKDDRFVARLLPESSLTDYVPDETLQPVDRLKSMEPDGRGMMIAGLSVALLGSLVFLTGFGLSVIADKNKQQVIAWMALQNAQDLPMNQWPQYKAIGPDQYIAKIAYENGRWLAPEIRTINPAQDARQKEQDATAPAAAKAPEILLSQGSP